MMNLLSPIGAPRKRLAAAAFLAGLMAPGAALACNPIEALFGACRFDAFRPIYEAPFHAPRHRAAPRIKRVEPRAAAERPRPAAAEALDADGVGPKQTPIAATEEAPTGSLALFRQDKTLRNGDIVATSEGFRVYRNGHFSEIAHDGGKLAQLEKASLRGLPPPEEPSRRIADRRR